MYLLRTISCSFLVAIGLLISSSIHAELGFEPRLMSFLIEDSHIEVLDAITERFEVVRKEGAFFEIYVPENRLDEFRTMAPVALLSSFDVRRDLLQEVSQAEFNAKQRYHGYDEVIAKLREFNRQFPEITEMGTYGRSRQQRELIFFKISDQASVDEIDESDYLISSATHGDEIITVEVVLGLIKKILEGYRSNQRLTDLVNHKEIYFLPMVNPDGFARRSRYSGGVDPNRAYPRVTGGQRGTAQCIEQLIEFFHQKNFVASMDLHAYGQMVIYPWGYSYDKTTDDQKFARLANAMTGQNRYRKGQISHILYTAPGSSADYYYWKNQTLAYGIELARRKAPRASQIPAIIENAEEMTWQFLEGVR